MGEFEVSKIKKWNVILEIELFDEGMN